MPIPLDAPEVLDQDYLDIRAKLLEVSASLDRIDRAAGSVAADRRMEQIQAALAILADRRDNRAEELQLTFSLSYDEDWRSKHRLEQ